MPSTVLVRSLFRHAWTLFLFTKSDIKTTLIPISIFAIASAPIHSASHVPHVVFWVWLHLLQFDVSNQLMDPDEDNHNKPDRPLPAKRISYRNATIMRWALVPLCWGLSALYSSYVLCASVALVAFTVIYDELHAHSGHFAVRNVVNAAGFASFELGSTLISGTDPSRFTSTMLLAISISAGIFATTIQAQDFKDIRGDSLIGRKTLPIVLPSVARPTLLVALLVWSLSLTHIWRLDFTTACTLIALSCFVGVRFVFLQGEKDDQISFYWYNVSLSV
ncbi:uncharacterized protein STEHIDRAFT_69322 [Stereum hirsutum FP-91666 SS1]|uniref:UbiA prenyltransferase n=1 Tax=Stereum hirsutum (strain FP-91666) TaxID=721885 RepID=R7RXR9_STEHR|nr:uncharacterized protein STEHIDRAFT_69322 [Stereum hirsutum FP-91666 SS1]EIM79583.1 hypothetical protein STEHIDRAFT_69322 [Stereum hirsutum FP-91666 SS1]